MDKPHGRGGRRDGAGRKTTSGATERKTVTLAPADVAFLLTISPNLSEAIRILIDRQCQR